MHSAVQGSFAAPCLHTLVVSTSKSCAAHQHCQMHHTHLEHLLMNAIHSVALAYTATNKKRFPPSILFLFRAHKRVKRATSVVSAADTPLLQWSCSPKKEKRHRNFGNTGKSKVSALLSRKPPFVAVCYTALIPSMNSGLTLLG